MTPDAPRLFEALEATWPPAGGEIVGPFRLRRGGGGGQRVSSAVCILDAAPPTDAAPVELAEETMRSWGQNPIFMIKGDRDRWLDDLLDCRGYRKNDLSLLLTGSVSDLAARDIGPLQAFVADPGLAVCGEIWANGGVGPGRRAVIARVPVPRTAILGRSGDDPCGVALAAMDGPIAMIHALHVLPSHRRAGVARAMMVRAARWAERCGARTLALAVVTENAPARTLFVGAGLHETACYHYRVAPDPSR